MPPIEDPPNWRGTQRRDGMTVYVLPDGEYWCILPRDDRAALDNCPCCGSLIRTKRAAMLIADAFYPMQVAA